MDEYNEKEILKTIEVLKEIMISNMQIFYETNCEILSKIDYLSYIIAKNA